MSDVSMVRLTLLRLLYALNVIGLGVTVWPALLAPEKPIAPMSGVAFALWGTLSTLSLLGLRSPLRMLPVLLVQFCYKTIWLLTIALPIWSSGAALPGLFGAMAAGWMAGLLIIPWPYVSTHYLRAAAEPWKIPLKRGQPLSRMGTQ